MAIAFEKASLECKKEDLEAKLAKVKSKKRKKVKVNPNEKLATIANIISS